LSVFWIAMRTPCEHYSGGGCQLSAFSCQLCPTVAEMFLKEHLWKSGKKRQHGKGIRMMDLGTIAEIPAASVVKKPRQKRPLKV